MNLIVEREIVFKDHSQRTKFVVCRLANVLIFLQMSLCRFWQLERTVRYGGSMCWSWDDIDFLLPCFGGFGSAASAATWVFSQLPGGQRGSFWTSEVPPKVAPGWVPLSVLQVLFAMSKFMDYWAICWGPFDSPRVLYLSCLTCWHLSWFSCTLSISWGGPWYNFLPYQGPRRCLTSSHRVLGADPQTKLFNQSNMTRAFVFLSKLNGLKLCNLACNWLLILYFPCSLIVFC